MAKPEGAGKPEKADKANKGGGGGGLEGKVRVLTEQVDVHPAGTEVRIVGKERNMRMVEPVAGGGQFQVSASQLEGPEDDDETESPATP